MRVSLKAWLVLGAVMALLWLAVEGEVALAGVALDGVLGWGLLGFTVWVFLLRGSGRMRRLFHLRRPQWTQNTDIKELA
ncbi:MAG: hypothetical protein QGI10_04845 [Vicinamibacterales bacterium]|nr:hypothetical protein [Vicinamibacterales bacterium]